MADGAKAVLDSIPELVSKKDAAALVALRDHDDKNVRKAVRKALHVLKARGVEIPEGNAKAWTLGDSLQTMRGSMEPVATVDTRSTPGVLRFVISEPEREEGARLLVGALGTDDRVLEFNAYHQTDGQRARMIRGWDRQLEGRNVPLAWIKQRIRYARERTVTAGFSAPRALDQMLADLGDAPSERPASFLREQLADQPSFDGNDVDNILITLGAHLWPPMLELEKTLERAAELHGDKPQPQEEEARMDLLKQSVRGDQEVRKGLKQRVANALEDAAASIWLEGDAKTARAALDMASALRDTEEAEALPWAHRLVSFQVASLLRSMGGMPQGMGAGMDDDHDHGHDHSHDHSHSHEHDHSHSHEHDHSHSHEH